jgi:aconitate hydratase
VKGHVVVGGSNYGQGSSREHAALGPHYLGLRAVLAKGFARIHAQNLINFGVLPLTFVDPVDYDGIEADDVLRLTGVRHTLSQENALTVENLTRQRKFQVRHFMSPRQVQLILHGGLINWMKERLSGSSASRSI